MQSEDVSTRDQLLTPDDVCNRLSVTRRWLRRADERHTFTIVKVGNFNRYLESEVEAYIEARKIPALSV